MVKAKMNDFIFKVLHIVSWILFVGLCIEAGGWIVNFIFSIYKPEFIPRLYQKLDLTELYGRSEWAFLGVYSFILFIAILKAYLFYVVIRLLSKLDLSKPFSRFVSKQVTSIAYLTFSIGILSLVARQTTNALQHYGLTFDGLDKLWADGEAFILMGAVTYVIACIFRKGVALQTENDLII